MIATLIIEQAKDQGMKVVIPPRKNRKIQREYDQELYKLRHLVENAFLHHKEVARYRHKVREKHCIIPRRRTNQMYCPMD